MSIASFGTPKQARTQDLDALPWLTQSPTYSALGWTFQVRSTDEELGHHLESILRPLCSPIEVARERVHVYSLIADGIAGGPAGAVYLDQDKLRWSPSPDVLLRLLIWHINQSAVRVGGLDHVLLHAGVVELDGRGVLLVAPEDHGKTTLTAALVRDGFGYLSDEVAAIDPELPRRPRLPEVPVAGPRVVGRARGAGPGGARLGLGLRQEPVADTR